LLTSLVWKSAIMYTSAPLDFHIVCDEAAETLLRSRIELLHTPAHALGFTFYRLGADAMRARLEREGAVVSDHSAGSRACTPPPPGASIADGAQRG
jgi:hypothetical protein